MITKAFLRALEEKQRRKWNMLYVAVDLHYTIIKGYTGDNIEVYPYAKEVLQKLSQSPEITLILFTSSYADALTPFFSWCIQNNILFKYLNVNPECQNNKTGDFSQKFYYNVLIDDRAGFTPETDWESIQNMEALWT